MDAERSRVLITAHLDNAQLSRLVTKVARVCVKQVGRAPAGVNVPLLAWHYVRDRTRYAAERGDQYIRTPRAFVRDRVGDCKTQAVFIAALCARAGHSVVLRYIISDGNAHYSHVYAVVDGVPVDPLLEYGQQCRYLWHHDDRIQ